MVHRPEEHQGYQLVMVELPTTDRTEETTISGFLMEGNGKAWVEVGSRIRQDFHVR